MSELEPTKRARGRPQSPNSLGEQMPRVRLTKEQNKAYRKAAISAGKSFSEWVRDTLDKEAGQGVVINHNNKG